jgi:hypothetical protein
MQTPDCAWRAQVVKRGRNHWYGTVHGKSKLNIAAVERILGEARIDWSILSRSLPRRPRLRIADAPGVA